MGGGGGVGALFQIFLAGRANELIRELQEIEERDEYRHHKKIYMNL